MLALPAYRRRCANPFQGLLYDALAAQGMEIADWTFLEAFRRCFWRRVDLWHLHHPDTVVFPRKSWQSAGETLVFRILLALAKVRGIRILWTVHDLDSSDSLHPRIEAWFWCYFIPRVDGCIYLSAQGRALAETRFPGLRGCPSWIVPHGHFRDAYPSGLSRAEARERLDLPQDAAVLLSFGLIRPYKAVPNLIHAFQGSAIPGSVLVVAGRVVDEELESEIRTTSSGSSAVHLHLRWIGFEEAQVFFAASDLVVLTYRRILNSGTLMLALTFGRPVLAPDKGVLREQQDTFGAEWIRLYAKDLDSEALAEALAWARATRREAPDLGGLDWGTLARQTFAIYEALTVRNEP